MLTLGNFTLGGQWAHEKLRAAIGVGIPKRNLPLGFSIMIYAFVNSYAELIPGFNAVNGCLIC